MMTITRYRYITKHLCLLLLLIVGAQGGWAEDTTTPTYYLDSTTWPGNQGGSWTSDNSDRYVVSTAAGYTEITQNGGNNNGTRVYTNSTMNLVGAGVSFILQFDMKIKGGSNQVSWFQVDDAGNTAVNIGAGASATTASSVLQLAQTAAGGTTWSINGSGTQSVTLANDHWYRLKLHRTYDKTYLSIIDRGTDNTSDVNASFFTETEITTTSALGGLGRMEFATKRYDSSLAIDNLSVQKWGWDVVSHSVNLTAADNNNKITSGMPVLYNPANAAVTYTYDGTVLSNYEKTYSPSPRLRAAGTGTVTATIGGKKAQYNLNVAAPTVTGSYDAATKTYTFDNVGVISNHSVDVVPFINMSFRGGPTAVVVNDGTRTVLKVIDTNGYSHPNLNNGASKIPPETNWGGTFYKFVPSVNGTLTVTGNMDYAVIYASDDTSTHVASLTSGTSISSPLEGGKTYYLYNAGSDGKGSTTPLLHSFTFVPAASSLTFRNPQAVITVDVSETDYTNPAISADGLPVSYSIMSGSSIADVDATGKVTFKGNYFFSPVPVVVKATSGTNNIAYTINLVKHTWIFNENDKWTTTVSDLTSGGWDTNSGSGYNYTTNGLSGTFYRNTAAMDHTQLTTDGSTVMPETAGLLINKASNNDRLYIAPKNLGTNFLAMRASSISIDDVQAGQTVTVNWKGGNSTAVLDMSDAAGANVTGNAGGTLQLTVTQAGRVEIYSNPVVAYINSITVSTPVRAIGTLTYAKTVLSTGGGAEARTGYTLTGEDGTVDMKDYYNAPGNFQSSNTSVATVDASGNITPVGVGTAIITATATAKNSTTHQASVTLVAAIEVVGDASTKIRTITIEDLLYNVGVSGVNAADGLDRRIPGFDLTFEGDDGVKVSDPSVLILRKDAKQGKLTITPRLSGSGTATITKALISVSAATDTPKWKVNGGSEVAVSTGGVTYDGLTGGTLTLEATSGNISLTSIKLYYNSTVALDETKVGPVFKFDNSHLMRIPADGWAFTQTPTQVVTDYFHSFRPDYTYMSSAANVATINTDGTNGQLLKSGESTITATFHETTYFARSTASFTINNTLLPGETYADVAMTNGQKIHIEASASAADTQLTLSGTASPNNSLSFGLSRSRQNTYAGATGNVTLTNGTTGEDITIYSLRVVTSNVRAWLYYKGQEDNYFEQVLFTGLESGAVAGVRVVDLGDPDNPIDLTDAYKLGGGSYTFGTTGAFTTYDTATGAATPTTSEGSSTLSHSLEKISGMAPGYSDNETARTTIRVLKFDIENPLTWNFETISNTEKYLGTGWTYDDRGFQYGYFSEYTPIFLSGNASVKDDMHGILLKDEYRWYTTRGLRANLSQPKASFKFPVKAGMEIDVYAATSSADISNTITNVTDINGNDTGVLYIEQEGEAFPVHNYFIAKEDGMVEIQVTDKVGMYLHSITLRVPEIHFTDAVVTTLQTGDDGAGHIDNAPINVKDASLGSLTYSITEAKNFSGDDVTPSDLATIIASGDYAGRSTLKGGADGYGWFEVTATNTAATGLEPKTGTYKVYVVDFKFDPATATLNLNSHDGEDYYGGDDTSTNNYPVGKDYVVTPINYSFEIAPGNSARAMMEQTTRSVPGQTTYHLTAYSPGEITLKAKTGRITAECILTIGGYAFEKVAPVLSETDITSNSYVFKNKLPDSFNASSTVIADFVGEYYTTPSVSIDLSDATDKHIEIANLYGSDATHRNHGAIRVTATDAEDATKKIQFVLTLAYPASSNKRWDFYRSTVGLKGQIAHDNKIGDYSSASVADYVIDGPYPQTDYWHTTTSWSRVYRNGSREPRWALDRSVHNDNAFIIEETAGLMIETPTKSFYVDNNTDAAYTHIGIHSRSTITIPKLKNGDFISLNLSRVIPNKGAIIDAVNVTDLAGKPVNTSFTITRSQIDYRENGELAHDGSGARIIPGYYTFIAHKDDASETDEFDVSFTLADNGYLDVLSIEIYSPKGRDSGNGYDPANGYDYTMLPVKLDAPGNPAPPVSLLKEEGQQIVYDLTYCHPLWSTSVGPAEYVVRDKNTNLNADFENVGWHSNGGAYYNNGRITVNDGYGRIKVRMENYTADGKYLIGYTPDYSLTVGHPPHQDYPFTWNFENISGGAVKDHNNNAYNSISTDYYTWQNLGYETFKLDTRTAAGSFYVPGATLVASSHDLGQKGEISYLNANNYGCDEFNGLGFTGQIVFRTALQAAEEPAAPAALESNNSLLSYAMNSSTNVSAPADYPTGEGVVAEYWTAGDGYIRFGNTSKRGESTIAAGGARYLMDSGNTKYLLVKPERALKEGDVITLKGYSTANVLLSGFSFYAAQLDNAYNDLLTLHWEHSYNDREQTITHTVGQGDGLAGRDSVYIFRAGKQYSVYLTEISITTTDEATPTIAERALTCNGDVTVTIPDLKQDYYVYIKSSAAPKTIPTNLTAAVAADGLDANTDVYKYKVLADGDANVTFDDGTKIYRIGVTDILKPLTRVGDGDAWATESRNHAIDYKQTGVFTVNDITANTVTAKTYGLQRITVTMNPQTDAMPAETGMVLKLPLVGADDDATTANVNNFAKAKNYKSANKTGEVPLFYPPHSTPILSDAVKFGGSQENLMMANFDKRELTYERETGVIDNNGDAVDDSGRADGNYTRFIFASRYMKWTKGETLEHSDFTDGTVPVFYRLHIYEVGEKVDGDVLDGSEAAALNTLGANKAYMLIHSGNVPEALWKNDVAPARPFIGIEGISDMEEYDPGLGTGRSQGDGRTYNLRGQMMDDGSSLTPGVYIRNGKKVVVK